MGKARWNRPTDVNNLEASRFVFEETKTKLLRFVWGYKRGYTHANRHGQYNQWISAVQSDQSGLLFRCLSDLKGYNYIFVCFVSNK